MTAAASYLEARSRGGEWLVRMEDLDRPRCPAGAADLILKALETYGFEWDGPVVYQSDRQDLYAAALERLPTYRCTCSRKEVCWCRGRGANAGSVKIAAPEGIDDFVLRRADGIYCYQLAVVVDDGAQSITDVVRGADLLDSTPRQVFLQACLGLPRPGYLHVPVVLDENGQKLSKQTLAPALVLDRPSDGLAEALSFLGHSVPEEVAADGPEAIWRWVIPRWDLRRLPYSTSTASGLVS